ncbi:MAG: hypothetical protein IT292_07930 [Deltaproteobacteria bacterium]|nr:hypothetical protein [Deltaproteobacteria bacterium]
MKKMAWFSPLGSVPCLVSTEFSRRFIREMAERCEITLFINDDDWRHCDDLRYEYDLPIYHYLRAAEINARQHFDLFCYQLEDDQQCDFCLRSANIFPGFVFCHDISVSRIIESRFSHITTGVELNDELAALHGAHAPLVGDYLVRRAPLTALHTAFPMLITSQLAQGVLVYCSDIFLPSEQKTSLMQTKLSFPHPIDKITDDSIKGLLDHLSLDSTLPVVGFHYSEQQRSRYPIMLSACKMLIESTESKRFNLLLICNEENAEQARRGLTELALSIEQNDIYLVTYNDARALAQLVYICDLFVANEFNPYHGLSLAARLSLENGISTIVSSPEINLEIFGPMVLRIAAGHGEDVALASAISQQLDCGKKDRLAVRPGMSGRAFKESFLAISNQLAGGLAKQYKAKVEALAQVENQYKDLFEPDRKDPINAMLKSVS